MKKPHLFLFALFVAVSFWPIAALAQSSLYVGSNSSGVSSNFTSGTNTYNFTYVGFTAAASNNTLTVQNAGTLLTNTNSVRIGERGSGNSLIVSNGATVAGSSGRIAISNNANNNSALVTGAGSLWTNSGSFYVGERGSGNSLVVSDGGTVDNFTGRIGGLSTSLSNTALVTGSGSLWNSRSNFYVGEDGSGNRLVVSNGGTVNVALISRFGDTATSSNNSALVTGAGSTWNSISNIYVGDGGGANSLVISNGGKVTAFDGFVGQATNSANNTVLVTGAGSAMTNADDFFMGYNGSGNSLTIADGGSVVVGDYGNIGWGIASSNNTALVTGTGSSLTAGNDMYVGFNGSGNSLTIADGGTVASAVDGRVGSGVSSANNTALVTGAGSLWTNSGEFYVGGSTGNRLVVSNGGTVASSFGFIGWRDTAISNSALVTGTGSLWTNSANLSAGYDGSGNSLVVSNGGAVASVVGRVGFGTNASNNIATIVGTNSRWNASGDFYVGLSGDANQLVVSNGGAVSSVTGYIGSSNTAANNSALITGAGSLWTNSNDLYVGNEGSGNSLTISDGGAVDNLFGRVGSAAASSNNSVLVTGTGSLWTTRNVLYIGESGSGNSMVVSNAGTVASGEVSIGHNAVSSNNSVLVTGTNSALRSPENFFVGYQGSGNSLVISNGGTLEVVDGNGRFHIGYTEESHNNSVLVTGAGSTLAIVDDDLEVGSFGSNSILTVTDGGTVNTEDLRIANDSGSSGTFNIGRFGTNDTGGTVIADTIRFGGGTGVLNFNQSDAVAISSQIRGPITGGQGTINQLGSGTTTLSAANSTFTGATTVEAGKLIVDGSIAGSTVTVNNGGTLAGSGTVGGIVLNVGSTLSPGNSPGTLAVAGDSVWNPGANYNWQIHNASGTIGSTNGWDWLNVSGSLNLSNLSASSRFNINLWSLSGVGPDTNGSAIFFTNTSSYTWTILTASNGITGFSADKFNINTAAFNGAGGFANALNPGWGFSIQLAGNNLNLVYGGTGPEPVPEPGTWAAAALLAGGAAFMRWRKRRAKVS